MKKQKNDPAFVAISDIHFTVNSLPLASAALKSALLKAELLGVPLIIAGDLNDTKAIIRAEVANALIQILSYSKIEIFILVGNHDLMNEKGSEHGLNYLRPYARIIDKPTRIKSFENTVFIPYQTDTAKLQEILSTICNPGDLLVMHQGIQNAYMGDYVQDKTSISAKLLENFVCISGHYHRHQTVGTLTYIGSPYTTSFGEANDGPKGFLVVNEDGTFKREILNLRKHVISEYTPDNPPGKDVFNQQDLVWIRLSGPSSWLDTINKRELGIKLRLANFKLDKCVTDRPEITSENRKLTDSELFDHIIDNTSDSKERKENLKRLWKELM